MSKGRSHDAAFKARVALEAVSELAVRHQRPWNILA